MTKKRAILYTCLIFSLVGLVLLIASLTMPGDNDPLMSVGLICTSSSLVISILARRLRDE